MVCWAQRPQPRYPRVRKSKNRFGTISKAAKLVDCVKALSNVKEEVYGALDSFIAWDLEFPIITVKKALKTLQYEKEWKRIIQVTKWMLSKGQGKTMGSYYTLINALAEDGRLEEADELWSKLFADNLESMPRHFFVKMISLYYQRDMHDKIFETFADMEELGIRPNLPIISMVGNVFLKLGMEDKYNKLKKKYPPPKWKYRYIKGKPVRVLVKPSVEYDDISKGVNGTETETVGDSNAFCEEAGNLNTFCKEAERRLDEFNDEAGDSNTLCKEAGRSLDEHNNEAERCSDELNAEACNLNTSCAQTEISLDEPSVEASYFS